MDFPTDPFILLSYVNTKLRDEYDSLESFCSGEDVDKDFLVSKLHEAGFDYMPQINQFR